MRLAALSCVVATLLIMAPDEGRAEARPVTRRALLIANSAYQHLPPLDAPRPNVDALADVLSKARFQPQVVYDLPQNGLVSTIRKFMDSVQPGDFVLIYYSGYGYQADELNYILPVGFDPADQSTPGLTAFSVRNLQRNLDQRKAGTRMLLLDASRPGPGLPNGLAAMRAGSNTLVSFSDAPDQSVPDPPGGRVNVFTSALIRAISEPGSKPAGALTRVRSEVSRITAGRQVPLVIGSLVPDIAFNPPAVLSPNGGVKAPDGGTVVIATGPNVGQPTTVPMWPMDGGDPRRSGYAPYRGPRRGRIAWSVDAGSKDPSSPLIGPNGRVYVRNTVEHTLRSVDNGRIVWSVPLPFNDQVSFGTDGSIQITSFTGRTRTLNGDGKPILEGQADGRYLGLYFWQGHPYNSGGINPEGSSGPPRFYLFRADARSSWRVELDDKAVKPVVDEAGNLYVGTNKGTLYGVSDAAAVLWSYMTGAGPASGLAVTRNREVLAAIGQSLFSVREGRLRWKFPGDGDGVTQPPIHDQAGAIYFGKGMDFYALSPAGKEVWRLKLGDAISTAPAMDRSGRIYVATATRLYCITDGSAP